MVAAVAAVAHVGSNSSGTVVMYSSSSTSRSGNGSHCQVCSTRYFKNLMNEYECCARTAIRSRGVKSWRGARPTYIIR